MHDHNNVFLAIALSVIILITWQFTRQYFFANSFAPVQTGRKAAPLDWQVPQVAANPQLQQVVSRPELLGRSPRVAIATPTLRGSISLRGGRIDDLSLAQYRETTDPKSAAVELLSPSGSAHPFYAEFGWVDASPTASAVPTSETVWQQVGSNPLNAGQPVR